MDSELLSTRAHALALSEDAASVPGFGGLAIETEARPHPLLPATGSRIDIRAAEPDPATGAPRYLVVLHRGFGGSEAMLERALLFGLERVAERAAADEAVADDEALFREYARFVRGLEVPAGWYRRGEPMGEGVWAVDLDVFVDLVVDRETWNGLKGSRTTLTVMDEGVEIEIPADADPDEAWTLEGCGLFEPVPGIDEDELAEDDGRYGDLHIVPYVY